MGRPLLDTNKQAIRMLQEGYSPKEIRSKVNTSNAAIANWRRKLGIAPFAPGAPRGTRNKPRELKIIRLMKEGEVLEDIGDAIGISRQRVDQILNPHKNRARSRVLAGLRRGIINRPSTCESCGVRCKPEAHHNDYSKPLEVAWLCTKCHRRLHRLA